MPAGGQRSPESSPTGLLVGQAALAGGQAVVQNIQQHGHGRI